MDYAAFVKKLAGPGLFGLLLLATTVLVPNNRVVMVGTFVAFSALAISLGLMVGTTGMLALGHAGFFGAGAYISTVLNQHFGWSLPVSMLTAVVVGMIAALLIGAAASARTAGLYFAVITFAFGELMVAAVNNTTPITGGSEGLGVSFGLGAEMPFGFNLYRSFSLLLGLVLIMTIIAATAVRSSQFGLRLKAIRESEDLAQGLGFNPTLYKTLVFVLGSTLATAVGVAYAPMVGFVTPQLMDVHQSIFILGLLFVGGINSIWGAFLGVGMLTVVPQLLDLGPNVRPMMVGIVMAVVVLVDPERGLAGIIHRTYRRLWVHWFPRTTRDTPSSELVGSSDAPIAGRGAVDEVDASVPVRREGKP